MSEELKCWDGKYPLFVEWDESRQMEFVDDEEELVEFCTSHQLNPRELQYYDAESMYAWEEVYVNAYELEDEYGELDEEVQALIDEFMQKLRAIKRPIRYNTPIKISEAQLDEWYVKVKGNLA